MESEKGRTASFQIHEPNAEEGQSGGSMDDLHSGDSSDKSSSIWGTIQMILDGINHLLIILVTVFLLYYSLNTISTLHLHIALCTIGYVLLMSEAIAVLAGENLLTRRLSRRNKSHIHWILQVLGVACNLAGTFIMYQQRQKHFRSIHAITGITSIAIMCFLTVFGYPVMAAVKLRKILRPVTIKFFHNFLGISCFVLGMVAQCYGYEKSWLARVTGNLKDIEKVCIVLTGIITILSLRGAIPSLVRQAAALFR